MPIQAEQPSSEPSLDEPSPVSQPRNRWRVAFAAVSFYQALRSLIPSRAAIPRANSFHTIDVEPENNTFTTTPSALAELVKHKNLTRLCSLGGVSAIGSSVNTDLRRGISGDIDLRRQVFGSNAFEKPPAKGLFHFVVEASKDLTEPMFLWFTALSLASGIIELRLEYSWADVALSIALPVVRLIRFAQDRNNLQNSQFEKLWKVTINTQVDVVRSGRRLLVSISEVVVGDVVCLAADDQIPADGLFISGHSLQIDESSVTGISDHVEINHGQNPFLFSGTTVAGGCGTMVVTSVGMNTNWGKTMSRIIRGCNEHIPLQNRLDKLTSTIGKFGLAAAFLVLVVLLVGYFTGNIKDERGMAYFHFGKTKAADVVADVAGIVSAALSTVSVLIPEGSPSAVAHTLAQLMKRMMAGPGLVRNLSAYEAMGSVTTICTDKTGILTVNLMEVTKVWLGQEWVQESEISAVSPRVVELVGDGVALNTARSAYRASPEAEFKSSGSPTEKAILSWAISNVGVDVESRKESFEILNVEAFHSKKKRSGVLIRKKADNSVHSHWKGAAEMILRKCSGFYDALGLVKEIDDHHRTAFNQIIKSMAADSLRCIALAHSEVQEPEEKKKIAAKNLSLLGFIGIKDQCHPEVKKAVEDCRKAGVDIKMITGDSVHTAKAIAIQCGILGQGQDMEEAVVEGEDFRNYTHEERKEKVEKIRVMARSSPSDKLLMVQCLKQKGQLVAVTGNRTKDAPALKEADVGLCMGIQGTNVAKESADIILSDCNFVWIAIVLKWRRCVYNNIRKFIQCQLRVSIIVLVVNTVALLSTGEVPLTSIQLVWVKFLIDIPLFAAIDIPTNEQMDNRPAGQTEPLITSTMLRNLLSQAIYQIAVLLTLLFRGESIFGVSKELNDALMFSTFLLCQGFKGLSALKLKDMLLFGIFSVFITLQPSIGDIICRYTHDCT